MMQLLMCKLKVVYDIIYKIIMTNQRVSWDVKYNFFIYICQINYVTNLFNIFLYEINNIDSINIIYVYK